MLPFDLTRLMFGQSLSKRSTVHAQAKHHSLAYSRPERLTATARSVGCRGGRHARPRTDTTLLHEPGGWLAISSAEEFLVAKT